MKKYTKKLGLCPNCNKPNSPIVPKDSTQRGTACDECIAKIKVVACEVVCKKCGNVCAYVEPGETTEGFTFEKGSRYHTEHCPKCDPLKTNIQICELTDFLNKKDVEQIYIEGVV